jgi:hypothetical protein
MKGVLRNISMKLVAAKRGIKKLDFRPSAKTSPNGRPKSNAPATIFIVSQNPTKR